MICAKCKRRLKADAVACLCGWTAAHESMAQHIDCCFAGCGVPALARVFTDTGWANVCVDHYPQIKAKPYIQPSPVVDEVLKAYRASQAYRNKNSLGAIGDLMPDRQADAALREPGMDDEVTA